MTDPREILKEKLIEIGVLTNNATIISLDAGSSQVLVNKEYFEDFQYSKQISKMALSVVSKFYSGKLFDDIE